MFLSNHCSDGCDRFSGDHMETNYYLPMFSPSMPQARSWRPRNRKGKRGSETYNTDREDKVTIKIFITSLLSV